MTLSSSLPIWIKRICWALNRKVLFGEVKERITVGVSTRSVELRQVVAIYSPRWNIYERFENVAQAGGFIISGESEDDIRRRLSKARARARKTLRDKLAALDLDGNVDQKKMEELR